MPQAGSSVHFIGGAIGGSKDWVHGHEHRAGCGGGGAPGAVVEGATGGHGNRVGGAIVPRLALQARGLAW